MEGALRSHDFLGVQCFTRAQVAQLLGVGPRTVHNMRLRGQIPALINSFTYWHHFPADAVLEFARTYKNRKAHVS